MRKIFIDCGYLNGKGTRIFKKTKDYSSDFELYAFEASPDFDANNVPSEINLIQKAVWIHDGVIDFYVNKDRRTNSLMKGHKSRASEPKKVQCIDFSNWITSNFTKDDYLVLKMDIERAEYDVLKKMYEDKSLHLFDIIYVEQHYPKNVGHPFYDFREKAKKEIKSLSFRTAIEWCDHSKY